MSCLSPLVAFRDHRSSDPEKIHILSKNRAYFGGMDCFQFRDELVSKNSFIEPLDLPCGQCFECRLAQSRDWANRLVLEAKTAKSSWFLTLTYDEEHLPRSDLGFPTLNSSHLRDFNKALTQYVSYHFGEASPRYFECGEYGSQTLRPHYHSIHFNLDPAWLDLKPYKTNFRGDPFYTSELLSSLWKRGYVIVGKCTWETCAYVARYVTKKLTGDLNEERFERTHCVQEFTRMSNRPGIGAGYFYDHKEHIYYDNDGYVYVPSQRYPKAKAPRYYDKLFDLEDPETLSRLKVERSTAAVEAHLALLQDKGWTEDIFRQNQLIGVEKKKKLLKRRSKEV